MASGSTSGNIALWDLERKRLLSTIYNAHHGTVSGMEFLQSQPLLVSNGADNSLNVRISYSAGHCVTSCCKYAHLCSEFYLVLFYVIWKSKVPLKTCINHLHVVNQQKCPEIQFVLGLFEKTIQLG